jgi:hypothetical protein
VDRRIAEPALLAAVVIVALAVSAATLPSATESGGSGEGSLVEGSGDGGFLPTPEPPAEPDVDTSTIRWLVSVLLVLLGVAALLYLVLYRREALRQLVGTVAVLALLGLLFWLASHLDLGTAGVPGWGGSPFGEPSPTAGTSTWRSPPIVVLLIVGGVLLGAMALVLRRGPIAGLGRTSGGSEPTEEAAAVGRAARRAADRIETTADVENEVYRAWSEMTERLDVARPDSSTPGEFATAAVGVGMDPGHVGELTRLFEDVRYGGDEPTVPRERRAVTVLRRIEASYAPREDDA